jgi:hypothetical protein
MPSSSLFNSHLAILCLISLMSVPINDPQGNNNYKVLSESVQKMITFNVKQINWYIPKQKSNSKLIITYYYVNYCAWHWVLATNFRFLLLYRADEIPWKEISQVYGLYLQAGQYKYTMNITQISTFAVSLETTFSVRFEFFTAVTMKNGAFRDATRCNIPKDAILHTLSVWAGENSSWFRDLDNWATVIGIVLSETVLFSNPMPLRCSNFWIGCMALMRPLLNIQGNKVRARHVFTDAQ